MICDVSLYLVHIDDVIYNTFSDLVNSDIVNVVKGQLLATYAKWGHFYRLEFDITVNALPNSSITRLNVFHFTMKDNDENYGDRVPAFWINYGGYFDIRSAVSGDKDHTFNVMFEIGKKYNIVIRQFEDHDEKAKYEIEIDKEVKHSVPNEQAWDFSNVNFYVSDPWHEAFSSKYGVLENFVFIQNGVYWNYQSFLESLISRNAGRILLLYKYS